MVTWIRDDLKNLMEQNSKSHELLFRKIDAIEERVVANTTDIRFYKKEIGNMKKEKQEERKEFYTKVGIVVAIISVVIGTAFRFL